MNTVMTAQTKATVGGDLVVFNAGLKTSSMGNADSVKGELS